MGSRLSVHLEASEITLLDPQDVDGFEAVRRQTGVDQRLPERQRDARPAMQFESQFTGETRAQHPQIALAPVSVREFHMSQAFERACPFGAQDAL